MKKTFLIFCLFFIILFMIPFFYQNSFSKYIIDDSFTAINIQIDKKPIIEVISVSNTNTDYEKYANYTHDITLRIKITEKNIKINQCNSDTIQILINNEIVSSSMQVDLISSQNGIYIYDITISNLTGNGSLSVVFPEGMIEDIYGQKNDYLKYDTNIIIDNIAPSSTCEELSVEDGKSQYIISANESLRPIDSWDFYQSNTAISKVFPSPISYPITITDYASNTSEVLINVQNATNILIYYANYNGTPIAEFDKSGDISGKQAIINQTDEKSEMLVLYTEGNISSTALQARVFDYTYWGEDTKAICKYSEIYYQYGYTPSASTWFDMTSSSNIVHFLGKLSLQLGGQGHNITNNTSVGKYNPIPEEIAKQNLYGLSGIALRLNDCEEYSIVYQIYVPSIGWLKASSDGEESSYSHDKPFSAIRINIVPKSEKQYLINYWNSVIYTDYVD